MSTLTSSQEKTKMSQEMDAHMKNSLAEIKTKLKFAVKLKKRTYVKSKTIYICLKKANGAVIKIATTFVFPIKIIMS